jgi:hypothetical protein
VGAALVVAPEYLGPFATNTKEKPRWSGGYGRGKDKEMMQRDEISRPRRLTAIHTMSRSGDPACEKACNPFVIQARRGPSPLPAQGTRRLIFAVS